ncbi:MAG TPA: HDOD domain-containing protein [Acidimicrobiia bacterium]|nr:HDOD domain-containing protein [Acidimicrobiia bacterium]
MDDDNLLLGEVTRLPVHPGAAVRLLWLLDDPNASAASIGALVETDPALSLQVIRMANAPYFGLTNRIASAQRAVAVLGFETVRALAAGAAFDLFSEKGDSVPPDFWPHSLQTAAAAALLAESVDLTPSDAFSAALLHDIGSALLFRRVPRRYRRVLDHVARDACSLTLAEREEFGITHARIGAVVLDTLRFPRSMANAVEMHHLPLDRTDPPLARVIAASDALAHLAADSRADTSGARRLLTLLDVDPDTLDTLVPRVHEKADALAGFIAA